VRRFTKDFDKHFTDSIPLTREAKVEDVANPSDILASHESSHPEGYSAMCLDRHGANRIFIFRRTILCGNTQKQCRFPQTTLR
jgi:hypothetical protein